MACGKCEIVQILQQPFCVFTFLGQFVVPLLINVLSYCSSFHIPFLTLHENGNEKAEMNNRLVVERVEVVQFSSQ